MTTGPSSHPLNTTGMPLNSTHIQLLWHPPPQSEHGGVIQEYRINITEHETGRMFQFTSEVSEITIGPLHPYYIYICTIAAFTVDEGPYSDNVVVITHEDGKLHFLPCQDYRQFAIIFTLVLLMINSNVCKSLMTTIRFLFYM